MQLEQPIQGTHPGETGTSALQYYLQDHATVPPELGIFLDRSFRMHPALCVTACCGSMHFGLLAFPASRLT
jgi:hypothetical protein